MRLDDCLTRAARMWPDRVATVSQGRSRTWRQVSEDVRRLAGGLRGIGVTPGERIAILAQNSDRYADAFFAASWLGAVIVPLNIRLSPNELAACVRDSGACALLADDSYLEAAIGLVGECESLNCVIDLGNGPAAPRVIPFEEVARAEPCDQVSGSGGELSAGIFYTGGTTSTPKGVVLSHDNLLANAWHILPALGWSSDTVFLHAAPMFHLADICCLVAVSIVTGTHIFLPGFEPDAVIAAVDEHRVTALGLVPTMINALTTSLEERKLPSLTSILYGGSPMAGELITRTKTALPDVEMWQAYGQTEAAPILTLLSPERHAPGPDGKARSAGLSVPGCEVSIRDPDSDAELPRGQAGEICGRGDNVMVGYWHRPDLTATVLRDGWLHTGDAGYLDSDGYLYVTGRIDEMIITGGENVHPAEVEDVLYRHPAVAEATVIGLPDSRWGQRIHAVLVARPGLELDTREVVSFCRRNLTGYKVPTSVEVYGALPKTGAGKVDKKLIAARAAASMGGPERRPA